MTLAALPCGHPAACLRALSMDTAGYGQFKWRGRTLRAHRTSYEVHVGVIAPGTCVCHTCDNRRCVNPGHLWLGSVKDNNDDRDAKGRGVRPRGTAHGSAKLTEQEVVEIRLLRGKLSQRQLALVYGVRFSTINVDEWSDGQHTIAKWKAADDAHASSIAHADEAAMGRRYSTRLRARADAIERGEP